MAEPIALGLGIGRPLPEGGDPPATRQIDLAVIRERVVVEVPEPQVFFVSIQLDPIELDLPPQRTISLTADRKWVEPMVPPQVSFDLVASKSWRDPRLPEPTVGVLEVGRDSPTMILVTEPLSVSAVTERHYPKNLWSIPERYNLFRDTSSGASQAAIE